MKIKIVKKNLVITIPLKKIKDYISEIENKVIEPIEPEVISQPEPVVEPANINTNETPVI
jgi:hypothetical protein